MPKSRIVVAASFDSLSPNGKTYLVDLFAVERIKYFAADREFRGEAWLQWLHEQKIHIRISNDTSTMNHH
ncbi:hypothetical protein [Candidatus Sororendozoicomonas aggregata]|uniref:hypothetical protein n=1 Tax=Candidatus Sororendozoicomonas aggregata TaxID=3073239 RepID=UPI002ED21A29